VRLRLSGVGFYVLVGLISPATAADPLAECRAITSDASALTECLDRWLETSHRAMNEALGGARAVAHDIERQRGGEAAVLGVEASQHAWEAYRDTVCQTRAAFVGVDAEAKAVELACMVEQTGRRIETLLDLTTLGSE
jgi:uncharacterized protein YecT (DUF1311 family)